MNNFKQFQDILLWNECHPPHPPIVGNNIIYLICGKLGCLENKLLLKKTHHHLS
jgi:hypothetical protein